MINQQEQNDVLKDCAERLERLGLNYMLTGSMALVHYALPRSTADIDIVLEVSRDDVDKFVGEFEPDYYVPRGTMVDAISRNRMFNILEQKVIFKIDCVIRKSDEFSLAAFERRQRVNYAGYFDVWITTKEDLILSKLNWAKNTESEMQMRDVASILRNGCDIEYVNDWAARLGTVELLEKCERLIGENYVEGYDA